VPYTAPPVSVIGQESGAEFLLNLGGTAGIPSLGWIGIPFFIGIDKKSC